MRETWPDVLARKSVAVQQAGETAMRGYLHHMGKANDAHVQALRDGADLGEGGGDDHEQNALRALFGGFVLWAAGTLGRMVAGAAGGHTKPDAEVSGYIEIRIPPDREQPGEPE